MGCDEPSEAIEAPERRNRSWPIWIEKTFSAGKVQAEASWRVVMAEDRRRRCKVGKVSYGKFVCKVAILPTSDSLTTCQIVAISLRFHW